MDYAGIAASVKRQVYALLRARNVPLVSEFPLDHDLMQDKIIEWNDEETNRSLVIYVLEDDAPHDVNYFFARRGMDYEICELNLCTRDTVIWAELFAEVYARWFGGGVSVEAMERFLREITGTG